VLVLIGIPFTFLVGFLLMSLTGMSINMLSLFALIMALGMIVDDAIVVVDNIHRHMELGRPLRAATIRGAQEVMAPVISAVLTTVAGFLPLLFMTGMIGDFMSAIPLTIAFALLASLLEAVLILPSHTFELNAWTEGIRRRLGRAPRFVIDADDAVGARALARPAAAIAAPAAAPGGLRGATVVRRRNPLQRRLERVYRRHLAFTLRHRYWAVASVVLLAAVSAGLLRFIPVVMFHAEDFDAISLRFELPAGTPLAETEARTAAVEAIVREIVRPEELKGIVSSVGFQVLNYQYVRGAERAQLDLDLVSAADRERSHT
jgi:multidrug efflux pump subunit AcrB